MNTQTLKPVTKEDFYSALMSEKRNVISGDYIHHTEKYYPFTHEYKFSGSSSLFGTCKDYGYVNGIPKHEYFLNN